uniref:Uncharacterized protein n=1 Tax=Oryza barthii TaxID=65489 RepID=A0A0D3GR29_9ORYZ
MDMVAATPAAHVLVFPCPVHGHITCMLHFATGLLAAGLHVTFLHSDDNLRRAAAASSPRLRYVSIPDGLPVEHPRDVGRIVELMESLKTKASVAYRSLLASLLLDDGCLAWLDGQADRSVVYVSLGSLTVISLEQFTEFLHGLVAAGYPFLWVLRPDMVGASQSAALREAVAAAGKSKARVVEWTPQRGVLRHRAVGCFLTHAGWNSTLEAAVEGVPMVCWPFFTDQQINSRFVGGVWRTGLDMKDVCDAAVVARMVREAMESGEIRASAQALAREVRRDVADGGSSTAEFKRLVEFIVELSTTTVAAIKDEEYVASYVNI